MTSPADPAALAGATGQLTIDDLARRVELPVRTIREYHTMRLLPPPVRQGRVGLYDGRHIERLQLITRLQRRGYSLAGIRDLLGAWESGSDLTTLLGVGGGQAPLDETPLRLARAELLARLPALDAEAEALRRACETGLIRPLGDDHFLVRSPALLGLVADGVHLGVPLGDMLDFTEALSDDLNSLAGKLANLIVTSVWEPVSAAGRAGELPDLFRRGRLLLLQGAASTLADRLAAALTSQAAAATDGDQLLAALDDVSVGAMADSAGTIHRLHRRGGHR
jgi:DNA-binding transcriptional MerR regulator